MKCTIKPTKVKFTENHFFLSLLILLFAFGMLGFIKPEKTTSSTENRALATFSHLTITNFLNGSFQKNFENAISDQFPLSEKIRTIYGQATANLPTFGIDKIICPNQYVGIPNSSDNSRATFNCEDYIIYYPSAPTTTTLQIFDENISKYNHVNTIIDAYYYFIDTSASIDFRNNQRSFNYVAELQNKLTGKYTLSALKVENFDSFKNYFYKTDHHWNYRGSYQGFLDIASMLDIDNPASPTDTFNSHESFFGSHARNTRNYNYPEDFIIYLFDIPEHTTFINKKPKEYGNLQDLLNHGYEYKQNKNFYAYAYGDDFGEVIFDFNQPSKENLLIISNSYSNAVNLLLAQYFNKTYVIDLRYYEKQLNKPFSISEYIKENNIKKTLLIIDPRFATDGTLNKGLEL